MSDELRSLLKDPNDSSPADATVLKVLVVDDEPTVHDITALVLKNYRYRQYRLEIVSAYSATEAREHLVAKGPFALVLLDVIMETDDAGLTLARYIREELQDHMVRIILRTGQPGMVPQRRVMREYEIDDYREKSELTSQRFDATITAALRGYLLISKLEENRRGLERVIAATHAVEAERDPETMLAKTLEQLEVILEGGKVDENSAMIVRKQGPDEPTVLVSRGRFSEYGGRNLVDIEDKETAETISEALRKGESHYLGDRVLTAWDTRDGHRYLAYYEGHKESGDLEKRFVELYTSHVIASLDNRALNRDLIETQMEIITTLGEVIETRSGETAHHVRRVGEISYLLGEASGLSKESCDFLFHSAPLHDIGKVGIDYAILNKPGALTEEEFEVIKGHSEIGHRILRSSKREILRLAAIICLEHHERWDGTGYPRGIPGPDISLEARIVGMADALDALRSRRVYKEAMPLNQALQVIADNSGSHFDPDLVGHLMTKKQELVDLYKRFEDG